MSDEEESGQPEEVVGPPSPLEFLRKVRRKIVDANPAVSKRMDPKGATQRLILHLAEKHFQIEEERQNNPRVTRRNYACRSIPGGLFEAVGERFLGIVVKERFTVVLKEDGTVEIKAAKEVADLMPERRIKKVLLGPTGVITPDLWPETRGDLNAVLSSTITYLGVFQDRMTEPEILPDTLVFPKYSSFS